MTSKLFPIASFRPLLVFIYILSASQLSSAQTADSLVRMSELTFNSDFEKEYFSKLLKQDHRDYLALFLGCDKSSTASTLSSAREKMKEVYSELEKQGIYNKQEAKKIKTIYKTVHSTFLKKYEYENNFSEVFNTGNYNCLSGTALYSIVLEKYNIPYTIKETPTHVFLVAYPETFKILIETTNPVSGYFQYSDAFIQKYLDHLKKSKLISEAEYSGSSKSELFNKYFFTNENINIRQLAGLQYYNLSLYKYNKEQYKEAYQDLQKAYLLYPSDAVKYLLKNLLMILLSKSNYDSTDDINYYIYISRFVSDEDDLINPAILTGEFDRLTEKQLVDKGNFDLYKKSYNRISTNVKDSVLKKEIEFLYNFEYIRAVINAEKDEDIDKNLKVIYSLHPQNIDVQSIIATYVTNQLINVNNPHHILGFLEVYIKDFKFLGENNKIGRVYASCYLELAAQNFAENNIRKGEDHLLSFEEFVKNKEKSIIVEQFIEKSYSMAAASYYKKGNYSKAKAILKKGLEYAPGSFELKSRLNSIN